MTQTQQPMNGLTIICQAQADKASGRVTLTPRQAVNPSTGQPWPFVLEGNLVIKDKDNSIAPAFVEDQYVTLHVGANFEPYAGQQGGQQKR